MDRDSYKSLAEAYEQIQEQGNTKGTKVTSGQVAGGVDRMLLRNLQRYVDNAIKAGRGIYDKSKEAGDAIIKGTADFTSDRITGGNTGDTIIRDRQKEAEKARQAIGADGATDLLKKPGGALNNILKQSGLPTIPGIGGNQQNVSRGEETPEERAARRARVGLTGNGEAGSPTGITPEVAAKQNAADAAAGRSTVRDTATGEPTNVGGGGSDSTPETSSTPDTSGTQATPKDTGGGGSTAGLSPMQQWAKNFPELAKKVKPGQAGYDEINKMSSTPAPKETQAQAPKATPQTTSQPTRQIKPMGQIKMNAPKLDTNKVKNNVGQAFKGLPEEVFIEMLVQQGLAPDAKSAKAISEHMSPEYRAYLEEGWAETAGEFVRNLGSSVIKGTKGEKVRGDANPVHRAVNAVTRGTGDAIKGFTKGVTGNSTVGDKRTQTTKKETQSSTPPPKTETPKTQAPKPETQSSTPAKPKAQRAPKKEKSTGSSRLDSALKWASDAKNKDAWMKEGVGEPKVNYLKDMDPYDRRRAPRDHAPGAPLPPPTPGIPEFFRKAKKDDKKKDTKTA